jgi:hypothetical protein
MGVEGRNDFGQCLEHRSRQSFPEAEFFEQRKTSKKEPKKIAVHVHQCLQRGD